MFLEMSLAVCVYAMRHLLSLQVEEFTVLIHQTQRACSIVAFWQSGKKKKNTFVPWVIMFLRWSVIETLDYWVPVDTLDNYSLCLEESFAQKSITYCAGETVPWAPCSSNPSVPHLLHCQRPSLQMIVCWLFSSWWCSRPWRAHLNYSSESKNRKPITTIPTRGNYQPLSSFSPHCF